jgi:peptide/nickel transport system substrate-binding protein
MNTRRSAVLACAGTAALLTMTACGAGGGTHAGTSGSGGKSLVIGLESPIPSLDPASSPVSTTLAYAYDPLIYWAADGSFVPDLATSWGYVGTSNTTFDLKLRDGARFADGSPLTAQAVVNSIKSFLKTPNPNLASAGPVKTVTATGSSTVQITYSSAFPNAVESLTQFFGVGMIIGPKGLTDPSSLETSSDGVGQYTLDAAETRAGSVYTFTANKDYFNQSAIQYKSVQLRIIPSASSRLSALESGQIQDATEIPIDEVGASGASGYQRLGGNTTWELLQFTPASSGPLSKLAVRQALEYAVDRSAIVKDFYSGYATSLDQFSPPGTTGYDAALTGTYSYDPAKAKSLLKQAGYGNGFTLNLLDTTTTDPGGLLAQELKSELAAIGVTVQLQVDAGQMSSFQTDLASGKFGAALWNMSSIDLYSTATQTIVSAHTLLNPGSTSNAGAISLLDAAAAADGSAAYASDLQKLNTYLTDNAVGVPICARTNIDLVAPGVKLPSASYVTPQANMIGPSAQYAVSG